MRKRKPLLSSNSKSPHTVLQEQPNKKIQVLLLVLFFSVLFCALSLRIYKGHHAGIMFDESMTNSLYAQDLDKALSSYSHVNNHVLNSVLIYFARQWFGDYEHYIRIPSILAGLWFVLMLAYVVKRTIKTPLLQIVTLAWAAFVPLTFDYTILARGNSLAMAAVYTQIALVLWLLSHNIKFRYWWVPALLIGLLNFVAFGAMLASALFLASLNVSYIFFYSHAIFSVESQVVSKTPVRNRAPAVRRIYTIILNSITIFFVTLIPTYFLFRNMLSGVARVAENTNIPKYPDFTGYMNKLLIKDVFRMGDIWGIVLALGLALMLCISLAFLLYRTLKEPNTGQDKNQPGKLNPANFILLITGLTILFMFIYNVFLNRLLAHARYSVYLQPVYLLSIIILLERFTLALRRRPWPQLLRAVFAILITAILVNNFPSPRSIGSSTMSGPLLHRLKKIDPDKTWKIIFSPHMRTHYVGFIYYHQFGYKFQIPRGYYNMKYWPGFKPDLIVAKKDEAPPHLECIDPEYFDPLDCVVIRNDKYPLPQQYEHIAAIFGPKKTSKK